MSAIPQLRFVYSPTFSDYWAFNLHVLCRQYWFLLPFAGLSLVVYFLAQTILRVPEGDGIFNRLSAYSGALVLPGIVLFTLLATYWSARVRWNTAQELREDREYQIHEAGIHVHARSFQAVVDWVLIKDAAITSRFVYLRTGQRQYYYFPVAVVPNLEQLTIMLRSNVKSVKVSKSVGAGAN